MQLDQDLVSDLASDLCLKDYMCCAINPSHHLLNISKFSMLLTTYKNLLQQGNLSTSRRNLGRHRYSRGEPAQISPWLLYCYLSTLNPVCRMRLSSPDAPINTTTDIYHLSRFTGNKGQTGGENTSTGRHTSGLQFLLKPAAS